MSDSQKRIDKLVANTAKNYQLMAEQQMPNTIGQYVMESLLAGQAISKQGLQSWINQKLTQTPSAQGKLKPENDITYQVYFAVHKFIEGIEAKENNNENH